MGSTGGGDSFDNASLQLNDRPWAESERGLMRFDLQAIDASRHGQLKRAVLRLRAAVVEYKS